MTPVMLLSDGYIANAAEPWKIPDMAAPAYAPRPVHFHADPDGFQPFQRDREPALGLGGARHPGFGTSHRRLGKDFNSGNVSYDRDNHQLMTDARVGKIAGIAITCRHKPSKLAPTGAKWRSSPGARLWAGAGGGASGLGRRPVGRAYSTRHIWPLPRNLGDLLASFDHVLLEMNTGQLADLLSAQLGLAPYGSTK